MTFCFLDAVIKSSVYFFTSCILMVLGEYFCIMGNFADKKKIYTLVSGVMFILGGKYVFITNYY